MFASDVEHLICRDPGRRGLIGHERGFAALCPGHLGAAAEYLAGFRGRIGIVTGFAIPTLLGPVGETDGPPGAVVLADCLRQLGHEPVLITDDICAPVVAAAMNFAELAVPLIICSNADPEGVLDEFRRAQPAGLDCLISIERVGPSHTLSSLQKQSGVPRGTESADPGDCSEIIPAHADRPHNMRGEPIDAWTRPLHVLFESTCVDRTIGIGDGGNEIGMGAIPLRELEQRLAGPYPARIACRIATDWTIVAGTSNWGAFGLAAATAFAAGDAEWVHAWPAARHQDVLEHICRDASGVDGVTRCCEATVDGLPFLTYIQPWIGIVGLIDGYAARG